MPRKYIGTDVLSAARQRIAWTFDRFERIYVSFSGGKDSTVMLHLVMEEATRRNRKVGLFFLDWECQFTLTVDHVREMFDLYSEHIEPYWVSLPIRTVNGCSQLEPEWLSWDENKREFWVREKDHRSISDQKAFPFYYYGMTFEEFVPLFGKWYSRNQDCACFVGLRSQESLNRFRAISRRSRYCLDGKLYTSNVVDTLWNVYPIYDWKVEDDWAYCGKFHKPYNRLYDRMYQAGMSVNQMRIDEPFGETQRISLWLYQIVEPQLWAKMSLRVAGANTGAMYSRERGSIMGLHRVDLPDKYTWQSFVDHLLNTMPPRTAEHYRNKIAKYVFWYRSRGYPDGIPDSADPDLESRGKVPSWRCICKALLRNDFWCSTLGFSATKSAAYQKYLDLMRRKRNEWGIYAGTTD